MMYDEDDEGLERGDEIPPYPPEDDLIFVEGGCERCGDKGRTMLAFNNDLDAYICALCRIALEEK